MTVPKIFQDDGRKITVATEHSDSGTIIHFEALDSYGLIPAAHYLETLSTEELVRIERIVVSPTGAIDGDGATYQSAADNVRIRGVDRSGTWFYNFMLLDNAQQHKMSTVLQEFAQFLMEEPHRSPQKIRVYDAPHDEIGQILSILQSKAADEAKSERGLATWFYPNPSDQSTPQKAYFHTAKLPKSLKSKVGMRGSYPESELEQRVLVG